MRMLFRKLARSCQHGSQPPVVFPGDASQGDHLDHLILAKLHNLLLRVSKLLENFSGMFTRQRRPLNTRGSTAELDGWSDGSKFACGGMIERGYAAVVLHLGI